MRKSRGPMDFSFSELLVIGVLAILVWGKQLPGAARKLARQYARFRRYLSEMRGEFERHAAMEPDEPVEPPAPIETPPPVRRKKGRPRKRPRGRRAS